MASVRLQSAPEWARAYSFPFALGVLGLYLLLRNFGLYPQVMADEWYYSSAARLQPLAESILPSYLYLKLYRVTSSCGAGFLDCARLFNVLWFVAAAPFLYLIGRSVCGAGRARWLAVLCLLAPINSYTAYFMPEAMYFMGFCLLSWLVVRRPFWSPLRSGLATGAVLGLLASVKVHALFLLPALIVFQAYQSASGKHGARLRGFAVMAGSAILAALAVRLAIGGWIAGSNGLALLGQFYGRHAGNTAHNGLATLMVAALPILKGHLLALALLFAFPLCALGAVLLRWRAPQAEQPSAELRDLSVWTVLTLGAALGMTVAFTATLALSAPDEGLRLHLRYYDFVFPLLLLVGAARLPELSMAPRAVLAVLGGAALLLAAWGLQPYFKSFIDGPELAVLASRPQDLAWAVALQLAVLAAWAWRSRIGSAAFALALVPVLMLWSEGQVYKTLQRGQIPDVYARAGQMTRLALAPVDASSSVTVVGTGAAGVFHAMFQIDRPGQSSLDLPEGAPIRPEMLTPRTDWMLVVGPHPLPAGVAPVLRTDEFALLRTALPRRPLGTERFAQPGSSGLVARVEGLSGVEHWGRWSDSPQVRLELARPLPPNAILVLKANAFNTNQGRDFIAEAGGARATFQLQPNAQDTLIELRNPGGERELVFHVPNPVTPKSAGLGDDTRRLGMGMVELEISARP
jgi:phosphoglycerol transferase